MIRKITHWIHDYLHLFYRRGLAYIFYSPPKHYLGHIVKEKNPVVLIPGLRTKWHFLTKLVDQLSRNGHPIYVVKELGYNTKKIHHSANLVREFIESHDLKNIIIVAHSKGGLIGKYILIHHNKDRRVKKVITVATPFGGTDTAKYFPIKSIKEMHPHSETIQKLHKEQRVNKHIVSIYGVFDNHVWPVESARLEGAKNIQVNTHGHHTILLDKNVRGIVLAEVEKA